MWFVLLRLQPWNGLLELGRKQKISDLDPAFHALYTIIHWSHLGARGTHRGRKRDCSRGRGHFHGGASCILGMHQACQAPCGVHSGTLGPGVRRICWQDTGDRHAATFVDTGSLLRSPPPVLPLEHTCVPSSPGLSSPWAHWWASLAQRQQLPTRVPTPASYL